MRNFETIDITHKSKRTQEGNILKAEAMGTITTGIRADGSDLVVSNTTVSISKSDIPQNVTPETAIVFYREHAVGEFKNLFLQTAEWLDLYRTASKTAMNKLIEEAKEKEEAETLTVDISEEK